MAILNANYMARRLKDHYNILFAGEKGQFGILHDMSHAMSHDYGPQDSMHMSSSLTVDLSRM